MIASCYEYASASLVRRSTQAPPEKRTASAAFAGSARDDVVRTFATTGEFLPKTSPGSYAEFAHVASTASRGLSSDLVESAASGALGRSAIRRPFSDRLPRSDHEMRAAMDPLPHPHAGFALREAGTAAHLPSIPEAGAE